MSFTSIETAADSKHWPGPPPADLPDLPKIRQTSHKPTDDTRSTTKYNKRMRFYACIRAQIRLIEPVPSASPYPGHANIPYTEIGLHYLNSFHPCTLPQFSKQPASIGQHDSQEMLSMPNPNEPLEVLIHQMWAPPFTVWQSKFAEMLLKFANLNQGRKHLKPDSRGVNGSASKVADWLLEFSIFGLETNKW